jgi:hypothetical protein
MLLDFGYGIVSRLRLALVLACHLLLSLLVTAEEALHQALCSGSFVL